MRLLVYLFSLKFPQLHSLYLHSVKLRLKIDFVIICVSIWIRIIAINT